MNTRKIAAEYRLTQWAGIIRERQESGLNVKAFCEAKGFHENIYFYWQRKLREAACASFYLTLTFFCGISLNIYPDVNLFDAYKKITPHSGSFLPFPPKNFSRSFIKARCSGPLSFLRSFGSGRIAFFGIRQWSGKFSLQGSKSSILLLVVFGRFSRRCFK